MSHARILSAAVLATTFLVGCGSAPPPDNQTPEQKAAGQAVIDAAHAEAKAAHDQQTKK